MGFYITFKEMEQLFLQINIVTSIFIDLLGNIQLVPQLPLGGHCNLSEIIKTQENLKGESNM